MTRSDDAFLQLARDRFDQSAVVGLCECGCGQPTTIAKRSLTAAGWRKGHPKRFVWGHHQRLKGARSYRRIARANVEGTTLVHRRRAEQAIGHPLPAEARILHPDQDPSNPHARLVICPDQAYHALLHARMRVKAAGGNPNTDKICAACQQVKPRSAFTISRRKYDGVEPTCTVCRNARDRARYAAKRHGQDA